MSWDYGALASEVYNLDKPIGTSFGDVEYYLEQLSGVDGPVLEPAVGTGRGTTPPWLLAWRSRALIPLPRCWARCRRHCTERVSQPEVMGGGYG